MKISLRNFKGIAPKVNPVYLQENMAQDTLNCRLDSGAAVPILKDANIYGDDVAVTISNATPGLVTWAAHALPAGTKVTFSAATGALPSPLVLGTAYFVASGGTLLAGSFALSTTYANAMAGTTIATTTAATAAAIKANASPAGRSGITKSIYRFGEDVVSDVNYWLTWTVEVDVCRGQIHEDTQESTYYTGDAYPRATNSVLALTGGSQYPVNSYALGIAAPANAPTLATAGAADGSGITEIRSYIYTFITPSGKESAPSPPATITWSSGQTINISGLDTTPPSVSPIFGNYDLGSGSHKRIYRTSGGQYSLVNTDDVLAIATTTYADATASTALGTSCQSLNWTEPPSDLLGLTNMPNGIVAGFKGRDIYLSEAYVPYAFPIDYIQTVDYPVVGMAMAGTSLIILTTGHPYLLTGTDPSSATLLPILWPQSCVSKRSIVSMGQAVWYASPDGTCAIDQSGTPVVITQQIFTIQQWAGYSPATISAWRWEDKYVAFYDNGTPAGFMLSLDEDHNAFVPTDFHATAGYNDQITDTLYLVVDGIVKKFQGGTASRTALWKSKRFRLPNSESFSVLQVFASAYPATVKVYADNALIFDRAVPDSEPCRLDDGFRAFDWEILTTGTVTVDSIDMAASVKELRNG